MLAVVTGGAGFIGSHLVDELIFAGHKVHVIDDLSGGAKDHVHPEAVLHTLDIRSPEIQDVLADVKPHAVFHQAAQVDVPRSLKDPAHDAGVNILGTLNLIRASAESGVQKFIYASSCAVYGDINTDLIDESAPVAPISFYGISKLTPEAYLRVFHALRGLRFTILRYANVYGPRQTAKGEGGVVALFLDRIRQGLPPVIHGDGEQTRDFVYVKDVARANVAAWLRGDNETVNVSTAVGTSVNQLLARIAGIHGSGINTISAPPRAGDIRHSCLDNRKARAALGWSPRYSMGQGLAETYTHVMPQKEA